MAVESLVNPVGLERGPTGAQRSQEVVLLCVCMGGAPELFGAAVMTD